MSDVWRPWKDVPRDGSPIIALLPSKYTVVYCSECRFDVHDNTWSSLNWEDVEFVEQATEDWLEATRPLGWIPFPAMPDIWPKAD